MWSKTVFNICVLYFKFECHEILHSGLLNKNTNSTFCVRNNGNDNLKIDFCLLSELGYKRSSLKYAIICL